MPGLSELESQLIFLFRNVPLIFDTGLLSSLIVGFLQRHESFGQVRRPDYNLIRHPTSLSCADMKISTAPIVVYLSNDAMLGLVSTVQMYLESL